MKLGKSVIEEGIEAVGNRISLTLLGMSVMFDNEITSVNLRAAGMSVADSKPSRGTAAKTPLISLSQPGRLRVGHLLALFSVSRAAFYVGLKTGKYPPSDGHDGRPFWKTGTVRAFLES